MKPPLKPLMKKEPRHPVDHCSTLELLRAYHGTLIAQRDAAEDLFAFLGKGEQILRELMRRVDEPADTLASGPPLRAPARQRQRDHAAALTRHNAALRREVGRLRQILGRPRNRPAPPPPNPRMADVAGLVAPPAQVAPWHAYRSPAGRSGGRVGLPPYGYQWLDGELEPVAYEQRVLERVRAGRAAAPPMTWAALAHALNQDGLRTRQGKRWRAIGLQQTLERQQGRMDELQSEGAV